MRPWMSTRQPWWSATVASWSIWLGNFRQLPQPRSRHDNEIRKCWRDLASFVRRRISEKVRRWLILVVSSIGVIFDDSTRYVFASLRGCIHSHHAFHNRRGQLITGWNGGILQRSQEWWVLGTTATVARHSTHAGSLRAVIRSALVAQVLRGLSVMDSIRSYCVGPR